MNTSPQKPFPKDSLGNALLMLFAGVLLAGMGILMQGYSNHLILTDPSVGCTQVGCAPGLLGFASLFCYIGAILVAGLGYLNLISMVRHAVLVVFILLGAAALGYASLLITRHSILGRWGIAGLVFLFLNGVFSAVRLGVERNESRKKMDGK